MVDPRDQGCGSIFRNGRIRIRIKEKKGSIPVRTSRSNNPLKPQYSFKEGPDPDPVFLDGRIHNIFIGDMHRKINILERLTQLLRLQNFRDTDEEEEKLAHI